MTSEKWYVLCCRECDDNCGGDPVPLPFETAEARGKWASAHTKGTGHERWLVLDQPREA